MNAARQGVCNRLAFHGVCNRGIGARNATTPPFRHTARARQDLAIGMRPVSPAFSQGPTADQDFFLIETHQAMDVAPVAWMAMEDDTLQLLVVMVLCRARCVASFASWKRV